MVDVAGGAATERVSETGAESIRVALEQPPSRDAMPATISS